MQFAPMYIFQFGLLLDFSFKCFMYMVCFFALTIMAFLRFQIRALDKITLERVSAERIECLHRIDQRAIQERLEGEKRQVIFTQKMYMMQIIIFAYAPFYMHEKQSANCVK